MDIRSLSAAKSYASARPATEPGESGPGIMQSLQAVGQEFAETLRAGEKAAMGSMTGSVDPHALVQALAQTELAVETAVTVRNKVVEAYQEILRMPV